MNRYAYVGYDPVNFTDPSGYFPAFVQLAHQLYGAAITLATFVPTFNYTSTGEPSYDWSKETWKAFGAFSAGVLAGAGCSALAGGPSNPAGLFFGAACGGGVGGATGAALSRRPPIEIASSFASGAVIGVGSGMMGQLAYVSSFSITENPYVASMAQVSASTGMSVGYRAAMGGEIDWSQVAANVAISSIGAFHRAAQVDAALTQLEAARGEGAWLDAELSRLGQSDPARAGASGPVTDFKVATTDATVAGAVRDLVPERTADGRLVYFREPNSPRFLHQRTAEFWSTRRSLALSSRFGVEYGAAVVKQGDSYSVSTYVTSGESGRIGGFAARLLSVGVDMTNPTAYISFAHGHPLGYWDGNTYLSSADLAAQAELVSAADIRFARSLGATLNIGTPTGTWLSVSPTGFVSNLGSLGLWDPFYGR